MTDNVLPNVQVTAVLNERKDDSGLESQNIFAQTLAFGVAGFESALLGDRDKIRNFAFRKNALPWTDWEGPLFDEGEFPEYKYNSESASFTVANNPKTELHFLLTTKLSEVTFKKAFVTMPNRILSWEFRQVVTHYFHKTTFWREKEPGVYVEVKFSNWPHKR